MPDKRSLYQEIHDSLATYPDGAFLAERFRNDLPFDNNRPIPAQIHEINIFWIVLLARTPVDSQELRLCLEDTRNRQGRELDIFVSNWLTNFRNEVIPFLAKHLKNII